MLNSLETERLEIEIKKLEIKLETERLEIKIEKLEVEIEIDRLERGREVKKI